MLFKNLNIYEITAPIEITEEALVSNYFVPCAGLRAKSAGWVAPLATTEYRTFEQSGATLLALKIESKVVPASAIAEAMKERIDRIEAVEARKLRSKERLAIKDDVLVELLPRALAKSTVVHGYIDQVSQLIVINTSSTSEADLWLNCLRDSLGSLGAVPWHASARGPVEHFTKWIMDDSGPAAGVALGESCDLLNPEDGSKASIRKDEIDTEAVRRHIETGKTCQAINIYCQVMNFTIDTNLVIRQLRQVGNKDQGEDSETPADRLSSNLVNLALNVRALVPALFTALGGVVEDVA